MKTLRTVLYWIVQSTWGIIETIPGLLMALVLIIMGNKPKRIGHTFYFNVPYGGLWGGFTLGPVIVTDKSPTQHTLNHEYGHTIQNMIFGPVMLFGITVPSAFRYWIREWFVTKKQWLCNTIQVSLAILGTIILALSIVMLVYNNPGWILSAVAGYVFAIDIWSLMEWRTYEYNKGLTDYDLAWFERTATLLGYKFN